MSDQQPFVDVIVVLWNSTRFLPALFEGAAATDYPRDRWRLHLVDNNPGDGSADETRRLKALHGDKLPEVIIHEPGMNTGFSGGNNLVMRQAIERGSDYCYLLNHDAAFEPSALREAVALAETDKTIGLVQSLLVLQQKPDEVNSRGNAIHYLGFGYCVGYHEARSSVSQEPVEIGYASGAGALYPVRVLREVGLLDETLWLYHEDLDLGWRIRLAGYRNMLAPKSVSRHHYEFSRSIAKWYWMERNRNAVVLKNFRLGTVILLLPQLIVVDIALFAFAVKGGWWREKLKAWKWFFTPATWAYIARGRREIGKLRKVSDADILAGMTPIVAYQDIESPFVRTIINPIWRGLFAVTRFFVCW